MPYKDPELARQKAVERLRRLRSRPGYSTGKNAAWQAKNPEKRAAHRAVEAAIRNGQLVREPCERCGDPKSQAHHEDYSKPLEVNWLCQKDHKARHREIELSGTGIPANNLSVPGTDVLPGP